MRNTLNTLLKSILVLLVPFWIITGMIRLVAIREYVAFEYNQPGFPADPYGFGKSDRLEYAAQNLTYLRENRPISFLANQTVAGLPLYNPRELSHMQDVQVVFSGSWVAWQGMTGLIVVFALADLLKNRSLRSFLAGIKTGGFVTAGSIAVIGLLAVVGWDSWFLVFHKLFFAPGSWTFAYTDTLIRLFPQKFWFDIVLAVAGLSFVAGLGLGLVGLRWKSGSVVAGNVTTSQNAA